MDDSPDFEQPDTARPYADWKAPAGDGELLIWPGPPGLLDGEGDELLVRSSVEIRVKEEPRRMRVPDLGALRPLARVAHRREVVR